jgi:hypothetical protein
MRHGQLSFLEEQTEDACVPVWTVLSNQQRNEVVTTLARVIVTLALAEPAGRCSGKEKTDE